MTKLNNVRYCFSMAIHIQRELHSSAVDILLILLRYETVHLLKGFSIEADKTLLFQRPIHTF